mmetsp:Transcript_42805/g.96647  ORF Transcript_42805/g.96647 Transcript_42805/m.96647 type:complete len:245 (-) Transcript_42805:3391-4125(-)
MIYASSLITCRTLHPPVRNVSHCFLSSSQTSIGAPTWTTFLASKASTSSRVLFVRCSGVSNGYEPSPISTSCASFHAFFNPRSTSNSASVPPAFFSASFRSCRFWVGILTALSSTNSLNICAPSSQRRLLSGVKTSHTSTLSPATLPFISFAKKAFRSFVYFSYATFFFSDNGFLCVNSCQSALFPWTKSFLTVLALPTSFWTATADFDMRWSTVSDAPWVYWYLLLTLSARSFLNSLVFFASW